MVKKKFLDRIKNLFTEKCFGESFRIACKACQNVGLVNALSGFLTIAEVAQVMFLTKIEIREIEKTLKLK